MTDRHDTMLDKVRKMLALAEDPAATTAEAEAFTAKATELMAKYGIEQAMVDSLRGQDERSKVINRKVVSTPPYSADKATLLFLICKAMGIKTVRLGGESGNGYTTMHLFGFESDIVRAEVLWTSLLLQQVSAMRAAEESGAVPYWENIKAWRRSFLTGFASAVGNRVQQAEAAARQDYENTNTGTSTALVVADRSALVNTAVAEVYPRLVKRRVSRSGSGGGHGRAAGNKADIGSKRVAGSSSGALSR